MAHYIAIILSLIVTIIAMAIFEVSILAMVFAILLIGIALYLFYRWRALNQYQRELIAQEERLKNASHQETLFYQVLRSAVEDINIEHTLSLAVEAFNQRTGWANISIALPIDEHERAWTFKAVSGLLAKKSNEIFPITHGLIGRTFRTGQVQLVPHVEDDPHYVIGHPDIRSSLNLPMERNGRILGVLSIESTKPAAFSVDDLRLAEALVEAVSLALDHVLLYKEARQQAADLSALYTVTRISSQLLAPEEALPKALSLTVIALGFDAGLISLRDQQANQFQLIAEHYLPEDLSQSLYRDGIEQVLGIHAYDYGEVLLIDDTQKDSRTHPALKTLGFRAYASIPMIHRGQLLGILCLFAKQPHTALTNDLGLLASIGYQISTAVANARLLRGITDERSRLWALIEASRDGIILVGTNLQVLVLNDPARRQLNLPGRSKDWTNRSLKALLSTLKSRSPTVVSLALAEMARLKKGDQTVKEGEVEFNSCVIHWMNLPVQAENSLLGRLIVLRNVTKERQVEQMRTDLTRTMVHDLRSPLSNIATALAYLSDGLVKELPDGAEEFYYLDIAQKSTTKMLRLVNNILDVSQLESGQVDLERVPVLLADQIEKAIQTQLPLAKARNLRLTSKIAPHLPLILVDIDIIDQVLQNLIDNAIKFTPDGGLIHVSASHVAEAQLPPSSNRQDTQGYIKVSVLDNGPGLSPELQSRIFQKFTTGNHNRKGYGLGLAFCKLAIEAHDGQIWVESPPYSNQLETDKNSWPTDLANGQDVLGVSARRGAAFIFTLPIQPEWVSEPDPVATKVV